MCENNYFESAFWAWNWKCQVTTAVKKQVVKIEQLQKNLLRLVSQPLDFCHTEEEFYFFFLLGIYENILDSVKNLIDLRVYCIFTDIACYL